MLRQISSFLLFALSFEVGSATAGVIFSANFDSAPVFEAGVGGGFSGVTATESVQGYAGIGAGTDLFGGNFLRNSTGGSPTGTPGSKTTLVLTNLPTHTSVNIQFLLAIIDSWDVASSGDSFTVLVDGNVLFSSHFTNTPDANLQGYVPADGVLLTSRPFSQLGFNEGFSGRLGFDDSAYNLGLEPAFNNIEHTASTLTVDLFASGPDWSGGGDESWAIDNVRVSLNGTVPEPQSILLWSWLVILAVCGWRSRAAGLRACGAYHEIDYSLVFAVRITFCRKRECRPYR